MGESAGQRDGGGRDGRCSGDATEGSMPMPAASTCNRSRGRQPCVPSVRPSNRHSCAFSWNRRKTAEYLSVSYKTLLNKIKECGITDSGVA